MLIGAIPRIVPIAYRETEIMKRIVFSLIMVVTALMIGPAFAREPGTPAEPETTSAKSLFSFKTDDRESLFGDRFTVKAGYKVWVANWQAQASSSVNGQNQVNNDHPSAMNGPTVTAILKIQDSRWFNGGFVNFTWLHDGFDFAEQSESSPHFFANRRDYSITGGITVFEGFGIFAGYYNSRQEFTNRPNQSGSLVTRHPRLLEGPMMGAFFSVPVSEHIGFYGNVAYALLNFSGSIVPPNNISQTDSVQGWMNEVGVTLTGPRIWKVGTELQMGFRAQIVLKHFGRSATGGPNGTDQLPLHDLTYGPIFAINAVF